MPAAPADDPRPARAAARAGVLAFFVDQFDIYLPVLVLAPVTAYFQPHGLSAGTAGVLAAAVFASTLITRPLGAAVFGMLADTTGRKRATLIAIAGSGVVTLLIAAIPGASSIGIWSVVALIGLRAVNGVFLGGEYTAAIPLALEWSPPRRRGLLAGTMLAASPAAYAVLAALTLVLLRTLPSAEAYTQWGWRVPFLIGGLLTIPIFLHFRRTVAESPTPRTRTGSRSTLVALVAGPQRGLLLGAFVLMTGVWLANNMTSAVLPGLLREHVGLSATGASVTMMIESLALVVAFPLFGALSQRTGRRRFYLGYAPGIAILGGAAYTAVMTVTDSGLGVTILLTVLVGLTTVGTFGPVAAYLTELFPAPVRATGFGVGYSLALVIPAFYAFYLAGLGTVVPSFLAPVGLLVVAGVLVAVGAAVGPETRDVDMTHGAG
ncbi:MFS transporter [Actinomycetospora endophytica]|uniref:MFS transporter n=1 Tax=Actinomycetospora endophytica TaxID=2291215 RepID=A0ABS8PF36_9PSEU|nr:MFS transporter [Actinomycetospora endophytica]MCD2196774.1 MFS transporter [Actinomycetospora endophytica]